MRTPINENAMEAERKMGQMLKATDRAKGTDKGGRKKLDGARTLPSNPPATLVEIGVTKRESAEAQLLAWSKAKTSPPRSNRNRLGRSGHPFRVFYRLWDFYASYAIPRRKEWQSCGRTGFAISSRTTKWEGRATRPDFQGNKTWL